MKYLKKIFIFKNKYLKLILLFILCFYLFFIEIKFSLNNIILNRLVGYLLFQASRIVPFQLVIEKTQSSFNFIVFQSPALLASRQLDPPKRNLPKL